MSSGDNGFNLLVLTLNFFKLINLFKSYKGIIYFVRDFENWQQIVEGVTLRNFNIQAKTGDI